MEQPLRYECNQKNFNSIPGCLIAYWTSSILMSIFKNNKLLENFVSARNGLTTGNNDLFLREWYEIENRKIEFNATDFIYALYTGKKWFPYNKGGEYRRWYGNQEYVINWEQDGKQVKQFGHLVPRSMTYMFFESISWSKISSGDISFRLMPKGFMFDVAGLSMFWDKSISKEYLLSFLNSNVTKHILGMLSPTLNYETGQISNLPLIVDNDNETSIKEICEKNIDISKTDWDSFEESWDFKKHPLI